MSHANRPSGPGKPINERRAQAAEQEEMEELDDASPGNGGPALRESEHAARPQAHNERAAGRTARGRRDKP